MAKSATTDVASPEKSGPGNDTGGAASEATLPPAAPESAPLTPAERLAKAEKTVTSHVYWSLGVGAIPVPIVDFLGIGALQLRLIKEISEVYGDQFNEHAARNIISALIGTVGGGLITRVALTSLIKTLPFAGAVVGGVIALPVIAGGSTYALGRVFIEHYENGGTLITFSPEKAKAAFAEQLETGKQFATNLVKRKKKDEATPVAAAAAPVAEATAAAAV